MNTISLVDISIGLLSLDSYFELLLSSYRLMFADDIKIYRTITKEEDHVELQSAISAVADCSAGWNLPLSVQKLKLLHLDQHSNRMTYFLDYLELGSAITLRDLGFISKTKLSFEGHY